MSAFQEARSSCRNRKGACLHCKQSISRKHVCNSRVTRYKLSSCRNRHVYIASNHRGEKYACPRSCKIRQEASLHSKQSQGTTSDARSSCTRNGACPHCKQSTRQEACLHFKSHRVKTQQLQQAGLRGQPSPRSISNPRLRKRRRFREPEPWAVARGIGENSLIPMRVWLKNGGPNGLPW